MLLQNGVFRNDHPTELIWNKLLVAYAMEKVATEANNGTHGANIIFVLLMLIIKLYIVWLQA